MISLAIGSLMLPWKKAKGNGEVVLLTDPKHVGHITWPSGNLDSMGGLTTVVDRQIARIKQLLQKAECRVGERLRAIAIQNGAKVHLYRPTVQRWHKTNVIEIWWDEDCRSDDGLYDCGLVILSATLAESMGDDENLLNHLKEAFQVSISPQYRSRQGLFEEFNGTPVYIRV
jgi:hypothetical protein